MTFISRLKNGFDGLTGKEFAHKSTYSSIRDNSSPSLDVHAMKMSFSEASMFSQPVWGPDISSGAGAHSREGYASKPFDTPAIPMSTQKIALQTDEDVQLAVNHLSSKISGGSHYWSSMNEGLTEYMSAFTKDLNFDTFDTTLLKETLWYGNSVWKPRMGIREVRRADDLMHIPISSFVRIWWDRQRIPYRYEFRGSEYQGYHFPDEILHFMWNPVNASVFGTGFGVAMTSPRDFEQVSPNGPVAQRLPSLLDRKYSTQHTMQITERRYIPHNVYVAEGAETDERRALQADVGTLKPGEDFVVGTSVKVQELGSSQRAFDPTQFSDLTMGAIMKAMNDFRGKQAGESNHSYANAESSALLDEIGLASFPLAMTTQLIDKIFKPWYEANPYYDPMFGGGLVPVPFDEAKFDLKFGRVEKTDIPIEHQIKLIELAISSGVVQDPVEMRKLFEDAGLGLTKEQTDALQQQYFDYNALPEGMGNDPQMTPEYGFEFDNQVMGSPPMDSPIYNDVAQSLSGMPAFTPLPFDPQPSNKSQDWNTGRNYERR